MDPDDNSPNANVPDDGTARPSPGPAVSPAAGSGDPPAPDGGRSGDGEAGAGGGSGDPNPPAPPQPKGPEPDWRDRRIAQQTAKAKQLEEELRRLRADQAKPQPGATPPAGYDDAEVERRASAKAVENDFLRRCAETEQQGRSEFGKADWDGRVAHLRQIFDPSSQGEVVAWNEMLAAAMETGAGARVLHHLSQDLNEAQRVMNLSVLRKGVELARLADRLAADSGDGGSGGLGLTPSGETSGAPRPLRPVGNRGPSHAAISPDDATPTSDGRARSEALPIDVWMARRNAQVKERGLR